MGGGLLGSFPQIFMCFDYDASPNSVCIFVITCLSEYSQEDYLFIHGDQTDQQGDTDGLERFSYIEKQ